MPPAIGLVVHLTVSAIGVSGIPTALGASFRLLVAMIVALLLPRPPIFKFANFASVGPILSSVGLAITVAGMTLLVWARQTLGRNWSQTVSAKDDHELVASGPYRYVRHPMYTGGILACFGSAIVAGGVFVFLLLVLTPLFLWRVRAEDELLEVSAAYKRRTKALIPFVW